MLGKKSFCVSIRDKTYFNLHNKLSIIFSYYNFHKIDTLHLDDYNLHSYEFIQFIDMPQLQKMTITGNKATNLQPLIKANLPSLGYLGL